MHPDVAARLRAIRQELRTLAAAPSVVPEERERLDEAARVLDDGGLVGTSQPESRVQASIHTIGIAVRDLADACRRFESVFAAPMVRHAVHKEEGSEWAWYQMGGIALELIAPTGPESRVQRFLDRRGEGLFLVSLQVSDMDDAIERFRSHGVEVVYDRGRTSFPGGGVNNFLHPKTLFGTLFEIRQLDSPTP